MIPLSDSDRRLFRFPAVTILIIGANAVMFIFELIKGQAFIVRWSLTPSEIASGKNLITILSAMFMHGGWLHIIGNMVYLWAFGPEIEDQMGRARYVAIYLLGGVVAFLAQVVMDPSSTVPNLGASGAIAAVMGAFLVFFPHDRIRTILFLGWFVTITLVPAILMIGFWFLIQLFSEVGALVQRQSGGIAYMAHIGGFVFGMGMGRLFRGRLRRSA
jgi:membrane associated rhomboid family serine protease